MEVISVALAAIALLVSIGVAIGQRREHRATDNLTVALAVLQEFREPDFVTVRHRVLRELKRRPADGAEQGFAALDDSLRVDALAVSHFFDHVGVLVAHRLVDRTAVVGFIGDSIVSCWLALRPYIDGERTSRGDYQEYFEILATIVRRTPPSEIRRRLHRRYGTGRGARGKIGRARG
jgi:hypothetical protein